MWPPDALPNDLIAKRLLQVQGILGAAAAVIALPFGSAAVLSVLVGAGVCLLANWLFAVRVFGSYRAQQPGRLLLRIYGAEAAKLALIIGLFGVAVVTLDGLSVPALLAAYLVIQVASTLIAAQFGARPSAHDKNRHATGCPDDSRPDDSRPDDSRPDNSRPDNSRPDNSREMIDVDR